MEPSRQAAVGGPSRVSADLDHADVARSESSKQSPVYDTGLSQEVVLHGSGRRTVMVML